MSPYNATLPIDDIANLQAEMKQFSAQFQNYASQTSSSLHKTKQDHNITIRELTHQKKKLQDEKLALIKKTRQNKEARDLTLISLTGKQDKVDALAEHLQILQKTKSELLREIDEARFDVERLERTYSEVKKIMSVHNRKDYEELTKYEAYMGLKVEAVANDHLKFRFSNINANSVDEEVYCQLYVGGIDYKVGESSPALSAEQTRSIEADLNQHGEIILFLKQIRSLLKAASRNR